MKIKTIEKEKAIALRRKGKSLREISRKLDVAKSSVSLWCRDISLTSVQFEKLRSRESAPKLGALANKIKRQNEIREIRNLARSEFSRFDERDIEKLKVIGTVLYWAEGGKSGRQLDFTNSDPSMIKVAMLWLRKVLKVPEEKFRASIYYHSGQDEKSMKSFWSSVTGIPTKQFHKSTFKKEGTGHRKNILYNGTCKIRVCNADLHQKVLAWIEQFEI